MAAGWGSKRETENVMCCGRSSKTATPAIARAGNVAQRRVGDAVRPVKWQWSGFADAVVEDSSPLLEDAKVISARQIVFDSEDGFKAWVAAGNPGTKKVVAV